MKIFVTNKLFDGTQIQENQVIVEDCGEIIWMGKAEDNPYIVEQQIDVSDYFLLPGFIDCHVHIAPNSHTEGISNFRESAYESLKAVENLRKLLSAGIVACRDLGAIGSLTLGIQKAINENIISDVPKLIASGKALCATGGHGHEISIECDGPSEFAKGTRQMIKDGAKVIKLMASGGVNSPGEEPGPPELTSLEIVAAVQEAHARGVKVSAHCHGYSSIKRCIEGDVDSIEHGVFMEEDLILLMKEKNTFFVPTLSAPYWATKEGIASEPNNPDHKKSEEIVSRHFNVVSSCALNHVSLAMGTDAGSPFNPYEKAHHEIVLLVKAGLTSAQAISAATKNAAELLELNKLGEICVGKEASFVLIKGNPFLNIHEIEDIEKVYIKGSCVKGDE